MSLSVCMIAKNEAAVIGRCLDSLKSFADEIIVYDTGSQDDTVKICKEKGANVILGEWHDNFARARNESIKNAKHKWTMFVDSDDVVPEESATKINELKKSEPNRFYYFTIKNINACKLAIDGTLDILHEFPQAKMFPSGMGIKFYNRVHETFIDNALEKNILPSLATDIIIEHHGYKNPEVVASKIKRNIRHMLYSMGFSELKDFVEFTIMGEYFCFYQPNTLTIWHGKKNIGIIDPFAHNLPDTDEDRFDQMYEVAMARIDDYKKTGTVYARTRYPHELVGAIKDA